VGSNNQESKFKGGESGMSELTDLQRGWRYAVGELRNFFEDEIDEELLRRR
jgi:hypothetical protein